MIKLRNAHPRHSLVYRAQAPAILTFLVRTVDNVAAPMAPNHHIQARKGPSTSRSPARGTAPTSSPTTARPFA